MLVRTTVFQISLTRHGENICRRIPWYYLIYKPDTQRRMLNKVPKIWILLKVQLLEQNLALDRAIFLCTHIRNTVCNHMYGALDATRENYATKKLWMESW